MGQIKRISSTTSSPLKRARRSRTVSVVNDAAVDIRLVCIQTQRKMHFVKQLLNPQCHQCFVKSILLMSIDSRAGRQQTYVLDGCTLSFFPAMSDPSSSTVHRSAIACRREQRQQQQSTRSKAPALLCSTNKSIHFVTLVQCLGNCATYHWRG